MLFQEEHKHFFKCETGTFSEVTEREYFDSQITLDKDEKKLFVDFFGSSNILHGNANSNPKLASKTFLVYPKYSPVHLNLLFPKHNKAELRLYISKEQGFKPAGGDIWFSYLNSSGKLVIGSMTSDRWDRITKGYKKTSSGAKKESNIDVIDDKNYQVGQYSFEPGAMTIIQMGQELIGHPTTAVNELIKNGYDADATTCQVYFHYSKNPEESFAIIHDNGSGMDAKTLFGSWLQPSVSSKRDGDSKSELFKRNMLGSKGVGRLAAMAIGKSVSVITKRKEEKNYNWLTVNRDRFREKKLLSEIKFPGDKIDKSERVFTNKSILSQRAAQKNLLVYDFIVRNGLHNFEHGTLIVIENLDDAVLKILHRDFIEIKERFNEDQFSYKSTEFYKGLATLITPITLNDEIQKELVKRKIIDRKKKISEKEGSFNVQLGTNLLTDQTPDEVDWLPVVPIPIHSVFDYRAYGKVTSEGEVDGFFVFHRLTGDYKEEPFKIPASILRNEGEQLSLFGNASKYLLGEYYFDIRIFDMGEGDNVEKLAEEAGFLNEAGFPNKSQFRDAFKNFQGLRVSKNGFGVKPYGEEVEDWIGLSKARVNDPGHNVNTNQILGYTFFFSPENDALEEKTNREGFLENTAYILLQNDLRRIFKEVGILRYNYRVLHGLGRVPQSRHSRPDVESYLEYLKSNNDLTKIRKYSEGFMQEVTTAMDNLEESLTFSERLASLGSGIELVYHEMGQPISGLKTTQSSLNLKRNNIAEGAKKNFEFDLNALSHSIEVLVELRKSLQPAIGKSRSKTFKPYETFLKVCSLFKSDLDEYKIAIKADVRIKDVEIKDFEYAFWISFLNIINNAVFWIKQQPKQKGKEIRFNIKSGSIIVSNNGPLIDRTIITTLFDYGVTKKNGGTGLGLAFTRSILSKINWNISAFNGSNGPVFTLKKIKDE